MIAFVDDHHRAYGIEPICKVLPVTPSGYRAYAMRRANLARLPARARRDVPLKADIRRVFDENLGVYGVRKVWRQLGREGKEVARCTIARLMRQTYLQGVVRGREVRVTVSSPAAAFSLDQVDRQFQAPRPNAPWLSDFTYVAFMIDAGARRIVGWWMSRTAHAGLVLDGLEQASGERRPTQGGGLIPLLRLADLLRRLETSSEASLRAVVASLGKSADLLPTAHARARRIVAAAMDEGD